MESGSTLRPDPGTLDGERLDELTKTRAALAQLEAHAEQLGRQLAAVGDELAETRAILAQQRSANDALHVQLSGRETPDEPASSEIARRAQAYRNRDTLILLPRLLELLQPEDRFVVVDGGARDVDQDPRWRPFPQHRLRFFGFEPDAVEAERLSGLTRQEGVDIQFFPAGLWGFTGKARFEHNHIGGGSSFLAQNREVTDRWKFENPSQVSSARDIFYPLRYQELDVISLGDWVARTGVTEIDFVKLNVQGGELEVLRGAGQSLDGVLGILVEVAFVESYTSRPLFDAIDTFLRQKGFTFFDLLAHHYVGRGRSPIAAQHLAVVDPRLGQLVSAWGQLVEAHALYLRDPIHGGLTGIPARRVLKLIALSEVWGQIEFAFELAEWLSQRPDVVGTPTGLQLTDLVQDCREEYSRHLRSDLRPHPAR